jgi:hypothetical protein
VTGGQSPGDTAEIAPTSRPISESRSATTVGAIVDGIDVLRIAEPKANLTPELSVCS